MEPSEIQSFDLLSWLETQRVGGLISGHCSAADANSLRAIRDQKLYGPTGLDWTGFCDQYLRIGQIRADGLIRDLNQFGAAYFQLAGLTPIAVEDFRTIAPLVSSNGIRLGDEVVALCPENVEQLSRAAKELLAAADSAEDGASEAERAADAAIRALTRLDVSAIGSRQQTRLVVALGLAMEQIMRQFALVAAGITEDLANGVRHEIRNCQHTKRVRSRTVGL